MKRPIREGNAPFDTPGEPIVTPDAVLASIGHRVKHLRASRRLTRKSLAAQASVSERYLAKLESGCGNASILFLQNLTRPLQCTMVDILEDETLTSDEWKSIRSMLRGKDADDLQRARVALEQLFSPTARDQNRHGRIALIGLRGAGKRTLGQMLADELQIPFIDLSRAVEQWAGCSLAEIYELYGADVYRRYEQRALDASIRKHPSAVIASPGGLVSKAEAYACLQAHCFTVWLQAKPEEHMRRVIAQGDLRPMAGRDGAFDDLNRILEVRRDLYARADMIFDTSEAPLAETYLKLRDKVRARISGHLPWST